MPIAWTPPHVEPPQPVMAHFHLVPASPVRRRALLRRGPKPGSNCNKLGFGMLLLLLVVVVAKVALLSPSCRQDSVWAAR